MALTAAQIVDVRRYMGYSAAGSAAAFTPPVYMPMIPSQNLTDRLASLTAQEEAVVTVTYLANLNTLEAAIPASASNMDTEKAGPWTANRREVGQRTALFNQWRRALCAFLGFNPGPSLGPGGITLVRG